MEILEYIGIASIPALIIAGFVSLQINRLGKHIDTKEEARAEKDYLVVKGVLASIGLAKAQAKELQTSGKTNGETAKALDYATNIEHEIENFYYKTGTDYLK